MKITSDKENLSEDQVELIGDLQKILTEFVSKNPNDQLSKFILKRDPESAIRYTAEHSLYMGDAVTNNNDLFLTPESQVSYEKLIMIGGRSEKIFKQAREIIEQSRMNMFGVLTKKELIGYETDQLYIKPGSNKPPYYKLQNEPIIESFQDTDLNSFMKQVPESVNKDYLYLLGACNNQSNGNELLKNLSQKKLKINSSDSEILENGFQKLKTFLNNL